MATKADRDKALTKALQPEREFCPDCCFYVDGKKELELSLTDFDRNNGRGTALDWKLQAMQPVIHTDGRGQWRARMSREAGLQFHRFTNGDIYERLGSFIPCHCAAVTQDCEGMKKKDESGRVIGENVSTRLSKENYALRKANAGQYWFPEPSNNRFDLKTAAIVDALTEKMGMD